MGIAEEIKQSQSAEAPAPPAVAVAPAPEVAPEAQTPEQIFNTGLPGHEAPGQAPAEATPADAGKETSIRIGDKVFTNQTEAIEYAQDLERGLTKDNAYNQGFKDAQPKTEIEDPMEQLVMKIEDKLFDNPREAIREIVQLAQESTTKQITTQQSEKEFQQKTWDGFYASHKDLANNHELVQYVANQILTEHGEVGLDKGLPMIADKTRALLKSYAEANKTETELPSGRSAMAGASGSPVAAVAPAAEKPIDFITQVRTMRNRRPTKTT